MRRRLAIIVPLVLLFVLAAAVTNVFPFRRMIALDRAIEQEQGRLEATQAENEALAAERDALLTDTEVERVARERFGYVRPGEQPYVVVVPRDAGDADTTPTPGPDPGDDEWYDGILDFLTGRDLAGG